MRGLRERLAPLARPRARESLPVRLDRRRIYLLPTRFGLFFALLLGTMALGALNYNNNPALMLALLLVGAALTSLLHAHLQLSGLEVVAIGGEPVAAGTPLPLRVHVRTGDARPRRGLRAECAGAAAPLALDGDTGEAVLALPTERRGWLPLPRVTLSTTQPLGLARAWAWCWPAAPVLVYPAPETDPPPLPPGAGQAARAKLQPAGDDIHHLRTYRRGDPRRTIAWKPSARRGALLVREYEQPQGETLELDWQALAGVPHELRIRRLARWVDDAEREDRRYRLVLPGQPALGPARGPLHRHACLRALALLPAAPAHGGAA